MDTAAPASELLGGEFPQGWDDFVGQDIAKEQLIYAARAAKINGERMPHTLLASGRPGIGKTTLALLAAAEMGAAVRVVSGQINVFDARLMLSEMVDGDVIIIDEFHRMVQGGKGKAEWLLHFLENGSLVTAAGIEPQPAVTIIAVTTDVGRLPETVLDRFECVPDLQGYTEDQATQIARLMALRRFKNMPAPSEENCRHVARAASYNPRIIRRILDKVYEIATVTKSANFDGDDYDLTKPMTWLGLTEDGLTTVCQRYLVSLLEDFHGRPAGAAAMADRLQESGGLHYTERLLMDKGYISKSDKGRMLTAIGLRRAKELVRAS